ncbi:MAG: hypothetical protein JNJ88_07910 [Planctomycetes bacterium]|nr:hypothetical protein [Planctomycetota bacterium]
MARIQKLLDGASHAALALYAGGGTAFFLFARTLFDAMPAISAHPRYDAGEVIGPIVSVANAAEISAGLLAFVAAWARRRSTATPRRNYAILAVALLLMALALFERLGILPEIQTLRVAVGRAGFDGDAMSPERRRFGMLHGISNLCQLTGVAFAWLALLLERFLPRYRTVT